MESAKIISNRSKNGHLLSGNSDNSTEGRRSLPSYDQIIRDRYGMTKRSSVPFGEQEHFESDYLLNSEDLRYEDGTKGRNNPFLPESASEISFPYSSRRRSIERTKWLAYAKSLRPGLNRKGSSSSSSTSGDNRCWSHTNLYDSSGKGYLDELPPRPQSVQSDILHRRDIYPPRPNSVQSEVIRSEDLYSPRPASVQSEIIHDTYGSHPFYIHKRYSTPSHNRPSRRMFSSGLRVRFSDEVELGDDARNTHHLGLEPTEVSHYNKKIRELFDQRYDRHVKIYSSESPTPTTSGSDSDDTVSPHSQLSKLESVHMGNFERSVHMDIPNTQSPKDSFSVKLDSVDNIDYLQKEDPDSTEYNGYVLEQELDEMGRDWNSPQFHRDFQYNMYLDRPAGEKLLKLVTATASPPDSAIELDTSSVQSALSLDLHLGRSANEISSDIRLYPRAIKHSDLYVDRRQPSLASDYQDSVNGQKEKPENPSDTNRTYLTSGFQTDSDVDSGISQEPTNEGLGLLWNSKQTTSSNHGNLTARPASAVPFLSHNGRLPQNNTSSDEDDSIMREIRHAHAANLQNLMLQNGTYGIPEDEVDDTDPSFGISVVKDDKAIQESYFQKRNPTRFVIRKSISSARYRPKSAPTLGHSNGDFVSNDSTILRKERDFPQIEATQNGNLDIDAGFHRNEYDINTEEYDAGEFFIVAERSNSMEKFILDRRKLSQASSSNASTLSNSHYSNQDGSSTWRELEGYFMTSPGSHGRLYKGTEDEIQMQPRNIYSDEECQSFQQREVNPLYATSGSKDIKGLEEIASEEFPEISDKSAKKKFHFNIFKTKRGKYHPDVAGNVQVLPSILKKPKEQGSSRTEMERCRSESDLLDDHHVKSSHYGSISAENLLSNDLYANHPTTQISDETQGEFWSSSNQTKASRGPVADSSVRKPHDSTISENENVRSIYGQLLSPEIFRNERPVAIKLDQSDIQQLDDMYDFSDDEDDDDDDDNDDDDDEINEDEDISGPQVFCPAEAELANTLPVLHEKKYAISAKGNICEPEKLEKLNDQMSTSLINTSDTNQSVKSQTLSLSVSHGLNSDEKLCEDIVQNEDVSPITNERKPDHTNNQPIEEFVRSRRNDEQPIESSVISVRDDDKPIECNLISMSNDSIPQPIESNVTSLSTSDLTVESSRKFLSTDNLQIENQDSSNFTGKKGKALKREFSFSEPNLYTITDEISLDGDQASSTLPDHRYRSGQSNLGMNKEVSASKASLGGTFDNLKAAFRAKFKKGKKKDKGQKIGQQDVNLGAEAAANQWVSKPPKAKKSGISLKKLFKKKASKGRSTDVTDHSETPNAGELDMSGFPVQGPSEHSIREENDNPQPIRKVGDTNGPINTEDGCCRLLEANPDGTQLIQLSRPQDGPIGLYIAKGNSKFTHGIYVSRFMENEDEDAARDFAGILNIGDEILEINGYIAMDMTLEDVYDLMCQRPVITLKTLPYFAQRNV